MDEEIDGQPAPDFVVMFQPEPTADERDAVIAALAALHCTQFGPRELDTFTSRWAMAGRTAAHQSSPAFRPHV